MKSALSAQQLAAKAIKRVPKMSNGNGQLSFSAIKEEPKSNQQNKNTVDVLGPFLDT